jgi:hypothetical protein
VLSQGFSPRRAEHGTWRIDLGLPGGHPVCRGSADPLAGTSLPERPHASVSVRRPIGPTSSSGFPHRARGRPRASRPTPPTDGDVLPAPRSARWPLLPRRPLGPRPAGPPVHPPGDPQGRAVGGRGGPAVPGCLRAPGARPPRLRPLRDPPERDRGGGNKNPPPRWTARTWTGPGRHFPVTGPPTSGPRAPSASGPPSMPARSDDSSTTGGTPIPLRSTSCCSWRAGTTTSASAVTPGRGSPPRARPGIPSPARWCSRTFPTTVARFPASRNGPRRSGTRSPAGATTGRRKPRSGPVAVRDRRRWPAAGTPALDESRHGWPTGSSIVPSWSDTACPPLRGPPWRASAGAGLACGRGGRSGMRSTAGSPAAAAPRPPGPSGLGCVGGSAVSAAGGNAWTRGTRPTGRRPGTSGRTNGCRRRPTPWSAGTVALARCKRPSIECGPLPPFRADGRWIDNGIVRPRRVRKRVPACTEHERDPEMSTSLLQCLKNTPQKRTARISGKLKCDGPVHDARFKESCLNV